jgi:hypothetical protein
VRPLSVFDSRSAAAGKKASGLEPVQIYGMFAFEVGGRCRLGFMMLFFKATGHNLATEAIVLFLIFQL